LPYSFIFDLSQFPRRFFAEVKRVSRASKSLKKIEKMIKQYRVKEITTLTYSEAVDLIQDLVSFQRLNTVERSKFLQTKQRALFLPHCSRKFMDHRCKAIFDKNITSYMCVHCSPDCLVNMADVYAKRNGYDVYVLPGASCVPKILKTGHYTGIVGVACGEEIKNMKTLLEKLNINGQALPLLRNGCSETVFDFEGLKEII
jgi:uncharacterized protein